MNILVTGANGQLGGSILKLKSGQSNYLFTDILLPDTPGRELLPLDITDRRATERFIREKGIGIIINCAAYTNVEAAEEQQERAELLNTQAPGELAAIAASCNALLIHISTDYVFGGESFNTPRTEDCHSAPTGVYGVTKLQGEQRIKESGCKYVIIRTSWLYSSRGNNFVKTILRLTSTRESVNVVFDQVGTPTYAGDLAEAVLAVVQDYIAEESASGGLLERYSKSGIYHYSNEGICSWYDFAVSAAELAGTASGCRISPCHSAEYPSKVRRPSYSVLDKSKIKASFGIEIPYWRDSLRKCINELYTTNKREL